MFSMSIRTRARRTLGVARERKRIAAAKHAVALQRFKQVCWKVASSMVPVRRYVLYHLQIPEKHSCTCAYTSIFHLRPRHGLYATR